jgi:hypothetical protein
MSETVAKQLTEDSDAFKNPSLSWMIGFLFVFSFLGLFSVVPLRKVDFTSYISIQFQDWLFDPFLTSVHVCEPTNWHCNGLHDFPVSVLAFF